ncbi:hypothetical protein [Leptospira dzoumogneensis]|uniref:Uncharacterized protein n=1 Tax=Leptospira dzoumogneensis TaxID=2484904 RepID=A0A4Z1AN80_9LEPT|nr:hypothetical protein [Leptospira dzoumogneensis]TGN03072.1 hypothetical protein EHR06_03415 [Leptospira dzoumogneensis]
MRNIFFFIFILIVLFGSYDCNSGGKQDCRRATPSDKKTSEMLQTGCLADQNNKTVCDLYLLEAVYHTHCW